MLLLEFPPEVLECIVLALDLPSAASLAATCTCMRLAVDASWPTRLRRDMLRGRGFEARPSLSAREQYQLFSRVPDCRGVYAGDYGSHGMELLCARQRGFKVQLEKLTGDPNVPRGKVSVIFTLDEEHDFQLGTGLILLAGTGHVNPYHNPAMVRVLEGGELLRVRWMFSFDVLRLPVEEQQVQEIIRRVGGEPDELGNIDNARVNLELDKILHFF